MTDHRQHLTTEDFAGRSAVATDREPAREDELTTHQGTTGYDEPTTRDQSDAYGEPTTHDTLDTHDNPATRDETATYDEPVAHDGRVTDDETVTDRSVTDKTDADETVTDEHAGYGERDESEEPVAHDEPTELSATTTTAGDAPLFTPDDAADYQAEWRALQADFVDDPREAVQRADELVAQVMQSLATTFNDHKHALEEQWQRGDDAQTEELRQALKRYRTFFDRLLSV